MKKLWSQVSGIPVQVGETERNLGSLNGIFIDPETGQIIAFLVGFSKVLVPVDIEKWTRDSVLVPDADVLISPFDITRIDKFGVQRSYFLGKKVLSGSGKKFGKVRDFLFESTTNSILQFTVSKGFFGIKWDERIFSRKDISEITADAVILNVEPEAKDRVRALDTGCSTA